MDGFLNLLKPPGMTSSDAVLMVRRLLPRGTRVGHGGTLDPDAAGVLPICVGRAARLFDYIIDKEKRYLAELRLGFETDTQDATGRVIRQGSEDVSPEAIMAALPAFTGDILQIPPQYSAIKRDGKRLYELARKGESVQVEPRPVHVHALRYLGPQGTGRHRFEIACGKGLYVRTLLRDIAQSLGTVGHMSFLLRTQAGVFGIDDALTPDEISERQDALHTLLVPMDAPLSHIPAIRVGAEHERAIGNGNPVRPDWIFERIAPGALCRVYCAEQFAGIGEGAQDGSVRFRAMLLV